MKSRKTFIKRLGGLLTLGWLFTGNEELHAHDLSNNAPDQNNNANAMVSDPLLGSIMLFAGNFAPRGWAFCDGQLLPISSYTALFSILGTTYGGDGRTTFALPDLRGAVPMGARQGPGLTNRQLGSRTGTETTTLTVNNLPSHNHGLVGSSSPGSSSSPDGNVPAVNRDGILHYGSEPNANMNTAGISNTGGNQPANNMQPSLALNYCIALQGIFPSRS